MRLKQLCEFCDEYLNVSDFRDYCPNGLQVESRDEVESVVCGVTASQALIEAAVDEGADTLIVHHGYFWKGESPAISGIKGRRIRSLIKNEINLLAYHLPLDAHPQSGNNAQLAQVMGWSVGGSFGEQGIVFEGEPEKLQSLDELSNDLETKLGSRVLAISGGDHPVKKLAWCTGAAQDFIEVAASRGVDAFVTGEVSEQTFHQARELGIHFISAGHHATERYGVQSLARVITEKFGVRHRFIDIDNPV